ncbi:type II secretion system minor pseudopilin GspK [Gallaecimonas mangrovi]|uniref:type II secretion system minor pseudopilin GspK n=1 Tax=Gallaecimonas mangrovi TaxID=2291597 RepID=UPI000E1FC1F2|nr:type II secretion system minor pseudopilin GspK [Gallaecimonas mangrovi]
MRRQQQGIALIVVLLILSVIVVLAANMASRLGLNIRRTGNQLGQHQAYFYALSGEAYAELALHRLLDKNDGILDPSQGWDKKQSFPIDGGGVTGEIKDARTCFNLNSLTGNAAEANRKAFQALLEDLGVETFQAETVAYSLEDWLDQDSDVTGSFGAEDSEYEGKAHPYLAANAPMVDKSELRVVNGVSAEIYQKVSPYICALDDDKLKVNINTIAEKDAVVLAAIFTPMTLKDAQQVISGRPKNGYDSVEAAWADPTLSGLQNLTDSAKEALVVKSDRFFVELEGRYQNRPMYMTSLLKKDDSNKLTVLWRRLGGHL